MVSEFSERAGTFQSDNLLSNERWLQHVIPDLVAKARPNRVYVGVGPEQNFTYIAALKPAMAFIVDIRRGNFDLHLMYKALFELSADRAEFVSRLFCRPRPDGLTAKSSIEEIFAAYEKVESSDTLYSRNMRAIVNNLTKTHGFQLSSGTFRAFVTLGNYYQFGPSIQYNPASRQVFRQPSLAPRAAIVSATACDLCGFDGGRRRGGQIGVSCKRGELRVREGPEARNLVVPVVSDFGGDKTIRALRAIKRRFDGLGVLPVQRRAVPASGRQVGHLLFQRRDAPA